MKLWLFGTYKWQGNPKALFTYMNKHYKATHELWWIADNKEDALKVQSLGFNATFLNSSISNYLFEKADVYVNENFRQSYPNNMNSEITILNLWHGVGIKHIELGLGMESTLSKDIVKKYIKNTNLYKKNTLFLSPSSFMDKHFERDTLIEKKHLIKGPYPRNIVYKDDDLTNVDNYTEISELDSYKNVYLFAPTYRYKQINGVFSTLIPDIDRMNNILIKTNSCLIIKVHPFMTKDPEYQKIISNQNNFPNIIFWNDDYDVYEIFKKIDIGIVDYSSIFYDMLEAGVKKYIRYIPDYDEYVNDSELIDNYFDNTDGKIAGSYNQLLEIMDNDINPVSSIKRLTDKFFGYSKKFSIDDIIYKADSFVPEKNILPELHTYDVFDTLFRRTTLEPKSIFYKVQLNMKNSDISFPKYIIEKYPEIRHQVEMDLRDVYRKTTFERDSDKLEITLYKLMKRLQDTICLSDKQINFLYENEIEEELRNIEPLNNKIDELFFLKENGNKILLLSDMYLPKEIVKQMLIKIDSRFESIDLYVSSEIGYQKSTGKLYEYLFFNLESYNFSEWIHHGDNNHADGNVPRSYGIKTIVHDMDSFIPFERYLINESPEEYKWDSYKMAAKMQRFRWQCLDENNMLFDNELYYSFAYIGTSFVPYVHWVLKHAIKQEYKILYFISRDGYFLKKIADVLIKQLKLPIETKYIYGSRKAWRVASFINKIDDESFTPFGMFSNITTFDDLVSSSQLTKEKLLEVIPNFSKYQDNPLNENDLIEIRKTLSESTEYQDIVLKQAAEKREIVTDYLKNNIDFSNKFAFVEFWGRGYTQDTLTRLLDNTAGRKVINPFYYIRNFTPNFDNSIRHRFTVKPSNFSYFEPIFAQTPYLSIPGYEYDRDGNVKPVIIPQENEFYNSISIGIQNFAKLYASLCNEFSEGYERNLAELSYTYQFANPTDYYITNVFSKFKDNIGMYGETREFAPIITEEDINKVGVKNLKKLTRSLEMSAARSTEKVRNIITNQYKINYKSATKHFVINDLSKYIQIDKFPKYIINITEQPIFENVNWSGNSRSNERVGSGEIIEALGYEWTHSGVPRIRIKKGYITASTQYVKNLADVSCIFTNGKQKLYKLSDIRDVIYTSSDEEKLDVLGTSLNSKKEQVILTNKGYLLATNKNILLNKNIQENRINLKTESLKEKYIIFKKSKSWYEKPMSSTKKGVETLINNIYYVEDVIKGLDNNIYLKIEGKYIKYEQATFIEVHKNYKNYIYNMNLPFVELKTDTSVFNSKDFNEKTKLTKKLPQYTVAKIEKIEWLDNGIPRLKINEGYISANLKFVYPKSSRQPIKRIIKKNRFLYKILKKIKN
ncbi:CDP-glycerol glycerophosphotransferase family protein [Mammaliicoccus fleurettii]|uniref:CDP-glycerol glycerophosphotransferase family protein n=1 Tax=Mammaliicoccus fleurettii TaxID=150056 RepID=UPI002DB9DD26|nr:CDP-glycerol glycerophosphotransferase family protein [Mammaliicoccus fleurettii]MEB7781077.1 CDP-glycerol glycerophosphotransferase family protein [Mammaliicoccus fleurettii]